MDLNAELKRVFGYESFRPGQKPLVEALLSGRDALGILPTGGGKSLCYQLPALLTPGLAVVVSPLLSLMKDQVDGLRRRGITGVAEIHSQLPPGESSRRLRDAAAGRFRLLYLSPERLSCPDALNALGRASVSIFVVDEAHCIAHWGHDFRPDYLDLATYAQALRARATLALTATATPRVREEIVKRLGMRSPCVIVNPFDRPNLHLGAEMCGDGEKVKAAREALGPSGSGIVYVGRQADAVRVAAALQKGGVTAVPYHGGMKREERVANQDRWIRGEARVVVGTVAFGMGIDKPDVRAVVHLQLPPSLESLYQEIGRAGRDGKPAACRLFWNHRDISLHRWHIANRYPSPFEVTKAWEYFREGNSPPEDEVSKAKLPAVRAWLTQAGVLRPDGTVGALPVPMDFSASEARRESDERRLEAILEWAESRRCRRATLLRYFGESPRPDMDCRNCDACGGDGRASHRQSGELGVYRGRRDRDDDAIRHALRSAVREAAIGGLDRESLGRLLAGSGRSAAARRSRQDRSNHFGALTGLSKRRRDATLEDLIEEEEIDVVPGPRPALVPASTRDTVPRGQALAVMRLLAKRPSSLTRTAAARLLGAEELPVWTGRLEALARAGYISTNPEGRLRLTEKGEEAVRVAELRGVS